MNALILKFVSRLYKLFKVYSALAVVGALAGLIIGTASEKPIVLFVGFMVVSAASMILLLFTQSHRKPQIYADKR